MSRASAEVRFRAFAKVQPSGCWEWTSSRSDDGYGTFWFGGRARRAHQVAYELFVGPIPDGLQLDHLCRNRACVNPDHLEPVTSRENTLRGETVAAHHAAKTRCVNGHPITDPSTYYVRSNGGRSCKKCQLARTRRYRAKKRTS